MHPLLRQILATARARSLFPDPGLAVVAVSGGPDSIALLHALHEFGSTLRLELLIAHLDHGLRGEEGARDAAQVGELAGKLGLPVEIGVRRVSAPRGTSLEEAARTVRYAFLSEVAARHRARYVAIAHTADDQAETLLMRLLRGAGPRGLQAMTPIAARAGVSVVRPLLDATRDLVRSYLNDHQLPFRLDRTNKDLRLERNRIRHVLVPLLSSEFNPSIVVGLGRTAEIMNEVDEHLTAEAEAGLDSGVLCPELRHRLGPGGPFLAENGRPGGEIGGPPPAHLELDLKRLSTYDRILKRMLVRQAILRLRHDLRGIGFDHIDALLGLAGKGSRGRRVELPGGVIGLREGDHLSLWAADPGEAPAIPLTPVPLEGRVDLPAVGLTVLTRLVKLSELAADVTVRFGARGAVEMCPVGGSGGEDAARAVFDRARLCPPIAVRSRRVGDRILPLGGAVEKKVKDVLSHVRVPRRLRPAVPLIVEKAGEPEERILWVAGIRRSAHAPVDESTSEVLEVWVSNSTS